MAQGSAGGKVTYHPGLPGIEEVAGSPGFHAKMGKFQVNQVELVALFGG